MSRLSLKTKIPGTELRLGDLTVLIRDYFLEPDAGIGWLGFGYADSTPTLEVVVDMLETLGDGRGVDNRILRQAKWFAMNGSQISDRNGRRLYSYSLRSAVYLAELNARQHAGEWAVVWEVEEEDCNNYLRDEIADPNTSDEDRARARDQMENTRWEWASIRANYGPGAGILASLGCIGDANRAYALQVNSELAGEAIDTAKIKTGKMLVWSESKALIILSMNRDW